MEVRPEIKQGPIHDGLGWRFFALSFAIGAICGTIGDYVHVSTLTDGYPLDGPFPFLPFLDVKMPIWVPFLFGTAVLLMATFHRFFAAFFRPRMAGNRTLAYLAPIVFVVLYAMTGVIQLGDGGLQDIWIAAVAISLWWLLDRTVWGAGMALANAIAGTCFEIFLVHANGFYYYPEHNHFLGVPSWLP